MYSYGIRPRHFKTKVGEMLLHRGYWRCPKCGTSSAPADIQLELPTGQVSWTVREEISLLCQALPFATAVNIYEQLVGISVSAKSAELWTEELGSAYHPPTPTRYEPGPAAQTLFLMADAGMLLTREDGWKERKVFAAWRQQDDEMHPVRYAVGAGSWDDQLPLIADLARREGSRLARQIVCIADGAAPIWKVLTHLWPDAFQLLDWYHLMEHVESVVKCLPEAKRQQWREQQIADLRDEGYIPLSRALSKFATRGRTVELRDTAMACLNYIFKHRERMNYPEAIRRGYPIGSGKIESAVKQVLQHRCKQAGMHWNAKHLDQVLAVRVAYMNGDWKYACQQARAKAA